MPGSTPPSSEIAPPRGPSAGRRRARSVRQRRVRAAAARAGRDRRSSRNDAVSGSLATEGSTGSFTDRWRRRSRPATGLGVEDSRWCRRSWGAPPCASRPALRSGRRTRERDRPAAAERCTETSGFNRTWSSPELLRVDHGREPKPGQRATARRRRGPRRRRRPVAPPARGEARAGRRARGPSRPVPTPALGAGRRRRSCAVAAIRKATP